MTDKVRDDFDRLPAEAQLDAADFIDFLRERYRRPDGRKRPLAPLADDPLIGMWQDREEMADSTSWVRRVRQQEWTQSIG